jgi:hypothetical protein
MSAEVVTALRAELDRETVFVTKEEYIASLPNL